MEAKFEVGILTLTEQNTIEVGYRILSRYSDLKFDLYVIRDHVVSYVESYYSVNVAIAVGKTFS